MSKIDEYELELLSAYDKGKLKSIATKDELARIRSAARATAIKDRRVNIRLSSGELGDIKVKALEQGVPYQTLIGSVLHKYVTGRLEERSEKLHQTVSRPWGTYTVLEEGPGFKIKRIELKPGVSLSLQMHNRRSLHWVVVHGTARVTSGESVFDLPQGESTFIPVKTRYRLENRATDPLAIIEVACGSHIDESDIVRFEDKYGRVPG